MPLPGNFVVVSANHTNMALFTENEPGAPVTQQPIGPDLLQVWTLNPLGGEAYSIQLAGPQSFPTMSLDLGNGGVPAVHTPLVVNPVNDSGSQIWNLVEEASTGNFAIVSSLSNQGLVVDVEGGGGNAGAVIQLFEPYRPPHLNQQWQFRYTTRL
ncbi:RICIN domain-containing protein [Kitasatospora sp. NPDC096077]|uniref:RICIN domain-containing protein n=1 Tax=Kitasatospora sp. NPDC096077 TaxID=3155544 RepID=UPI003329421C